MSEESNRRSVPELLELAKDGLVVGWTAQELKGERWVREEHVIDISGRYMELAEAVCESLDEA